MDNSAGPFKLPKPVSKRSTSHFKSDFISKEKAPIKSDPAKSDVSTKELKGVSTKELNDVSTQGFEDVSTKELKDVSTKDLKDASTTGVDVSIKEFKDTSTNVLKNVSKISLEKKTVKKPSQSTPSVNLSSIYTIPEWSGVPPGDFNFEVIKQGTIISTIPLTKASLLIGRLPGCDIQLDHPTISRYHAVLQYCKGVENRPPGFYVYDLGSTHGTFMNKMPQKASLYYSLKVGHILQFGMSTRIFVLQGMEEQESIETEIAESAPVSHVCDWGMKDDAEDDGSENPFALSTENEELYFSDPKKTLRGWFEREGYELEYNVEEKGLSNFVCTIQLPIDNSTSGYLTVTGSVSRRKKDSVVACALDACRTLDRFGLLRQSHHTSRQPKKKNWEDDDFYDSDEDPFLDRTGMLDKKREWRKNFGKQSPAQNYESIVKKLEIVCNDINEIKEKLHQARTKQMKIIESDEVDPLDSYMAQISDPQKVPLNPVMISKLKSDLLELEKQKNILEQLKVASESPQHKPVSFAKTVEKKSKSQKLSTFVSPLVSFSKDFNSSLTDVKNMDASTHEDAGEKQCDETEIKSEKTIIQDVKPEFQDIGNMKDLSQSKTLNSSKKLKRPLELPAKATKRQTVTKKTKNSHTMQCDSGEYSMWLPPEGQHGDGSTHLNGKYGY